MPLDLAKLQDDFYKYFLDTYHQKHDAQPPTAQSPAAGSAVNAFLAFATFGTPITPEMFQLQDGSFFTPLVTEQFSRLANLLPEVEGTTIGSAGLMSADEAYGAMVDQAMPLTPSDMQALGTLKGDAQSKFAAAGVEPRIAGGVEFRPALPIPPDWPLPSANDAWKTMSFTQTETTVVGPPPPPWVWRWRVAPAELQGALQSVSAMEAVVPIRAAPAPSAKQAASATMLKSAALAAAPRVAVAAQVSAPVTASRATAPVAALRAASSVATMEDSPAVIRTRPGPVVNPRIEMIKAQRAEMLQLRLQELRERSQPQSVTSHSLTISFEYCLVTALRPWISGAFLTARNWYLPRYRAGEIASGTGTGSGFFEAIPTAALCVRNLTLKAEWSAEENSVLASFAKFGPFSLVGREIHAESNSLICRGTQVVGWVFEPLPQLPPNSDPALPAVPHA